MALCRPQMLSDSICFWIDEREREREVLFIPFPRAYPIVIRMLVIYMER